MKEDNELHMISYWLDRKGPEELKEYYYPNLFIKDEILNKLYVDMMASKKAFELYVKDLENNAEY